MNYLRAQKTGNQEPWTLEQLKAGLENFNTKHGRYPTAPEIDAHPYLPSARTIERKFGGVIGLRKTLGLDTQSDMREGAHSSKRASTINAQARKVKKEVLTYLSKVFGGQSVHREYFFLDDKRTRADFFVDDSKGGFCVDVFYPSDRRNLTGCLNSKLEKYQGLQMNPVRDCEGSQHGPISNGMNQYPVIFLQMNKELDQSILDAVIKNKKKKLLAGHRLMSWDSFTEFCNNREQL